MAAPGINGVSNGGVETTRSATQDRAHRPAYQSTIQRIVVPLDGSDLAEVALPHAVAIGQAFNASIHVLSVIEPSPGPSKQATADSAEWRLARAGRRAYIERIVAELSSIGLTVKSDLVGGSASDQILRFVEAIDADLLVLTSHGRGGLTEFDLSGTVSKVVHTARCSVLLVPARTHDAHGTPATYSRLLVPVDCTQRSKWAVHLAGVIARPHRAELVLTTIIERPAVLGGAKARAQAAPLVESLTLLNRQTARGHLDWLADEAAGANIPVRRRIVEGENVGRSLLHLAESERCSLIVLSAHGGSPSTPMLHGSVARLLLERATKPVLVLQDMPIRPRSTRSRTLEGALRTFGVPGT